MKSFLTPNTLYTKQKANAFNIQNNNRRDIFGCLVYVKSNGKENKRKGHRKGKINKVESSF